MLQTGHQRVVSSCSVVAGDDINARIEGQLEAVIRSEVMEQRLLKNITVPFRFGFDFYLAESAADGVVSGDGLWSMLVALRVQHRSTMCADVNKP